MSTISITFQTQVLDGGQSNRGMVNVIFNDGNQDLTLNLELANISTYKKFLEVAWVDGASGEDDAQADNYGVSFKRDYGSVGGTKNLTVSRVDNIITITAKSGTFPVGQSNYTGDILIVGFAYNNVTQTVAPELSVAATGNGDCTNVEYSITATGDGSPWRLVAGSTVINSNWDGSAELVDLARADIQHLIKLQDASNFSVLDSKTQIVPRDLKIGEFKTRTTQYVGYSDVLIDNVNPVAGTEPIEYSLDVQGTATGGNYQTSNVLTGVLPGFYELFVRDRFGCEITKTIQVMSLEDASEEENPRFFDIPKGNSIIFSECTEFNETVKPNFNNTLSHNELSGINYPIVQYWNSKDFEPIHFKSSYPYHVVTLHKNDGTKQDLPIVEVQNNRGSLEKVDCQLFTIDSTTTGVYFNGGNEYEPNTTTIKGTSPYPQFLPSWAVEGQIVSIDGLGSFEIQEIGYDSALQRGYFTINMSTNATTGLVQVTWNIQVYNVFEAFVPFSGVDKARIVIEKGFNDGSVLIDGNPFVSELQQVKENENDDLLIEWSSSKNQSEIVFLSGVKFHKRLKGKFRPIFPNNSELVEGDSRAYTLDQEFYQHYRLELERLSARECYQLIVASMTDGFTVNGESLKQNGQAEVEPLGESNFFTFKCDYALGANNAATQPDSLALNSSTGVVGGGSTGKPSAPPTYDGETRLNIGGGFVTVGGDFISVG